MMLCIEPLKRNLRYNDVIGEKQTLNPSTMKISEISVANDSSV